MGVITWHDEGMKQQHLTVVKRITVQFIVAIAAW